MIRIEYNAQTGGLTEIEVEDIEMSEVEEPIEIKIERLKQELSETDYKIIKCYEYQLIGLELPYDIQKFHTERQEIRNKINELELI